MTYDMERGEQPGQTGHPRLWKELSGRGQRGVVTAAFRQNAGWSGACNRQGGAVVWGWSHVPFFGTTTGGPCAQK
ncbi:hypothetical protein SKAU_G00158190 [Synaphobranchus kaupii]|uniref:Uncharacterized protein n=1 Tax=Synaphobranchus kaupii TaxID=118154 RepID=A0A9Q1IXC7_SYNKA|nr:hypothetical protein SKAU_G00158190 [Synaphobranchus kaupii]